MNERLEAILAHLHAAEAEIERAVALFHVEGRLSSDRRKLYRELVARNERARVVRAWLLIREASRKVARCCEPTVKVRE